MKQLHLIRKSITKSQHKRYSFLFNKTVNYFPDETVTFD